MLVDELDVGSEGEWVQTLGSCKLPSLSRCLVLFCGDAMGHPDTRAVVWVWGRMAMLQQK